MLKEITFDRPFRVRSKYAYEHNLLHDFHGSSKKIMCLEYDSEISAKLAYNPIDMYIKRNRMPLKVNKRNNALYITREAEQENA